MFFVRGVEIYLLQENRRVRIEVNLNELRRSGLAVSTQVLGLARIILTRKEEQE